MDIRDAEYWKNRSEAAFEMILALADILPDEMFTQQLAIAYGTRVHERLQGRSAEVRDEASVIFDDLMRAYDGDTNA